MENKVLRDIYDTLLDTNELFELMPNAVGLWERDKAKFSEIQNGLNMSIEDPENPELELFHTMEIQSLLLEDEEEDPYYDDEYFG